VADVGGGNVAARLERGGAGRGAVHAEGAEDAGLEEVVPGRAGGRGDDLSSDHVHDVVVVVAGTEPVDLGQVAGAPDDLDPIQGGGDPDVVVAGDTGPVGEEVPDRYVTCDVWVGELEPGQVVDDGVVPLDGALVDQHAQSGGGHGLGSGGDGEEGVLIDGLTGTDLPFAVTPCEDDLVAVDDGDGEAGDLPVDHGLPEVGVEAFQLGCLGSEGCEAGGEERREEEGCAEAGHPCEKPSHDSHPASVSGPGVPQRRIRGRATGVKAVGIGVRGAGHG
jgi:hypothetical protein